MNFLKKYFILFLIIFISSTNNSRSDFFKDVTSIIENNEPRLSYGVSVTDINSDNKYDFVVTGFGFFNSENSVSKS